MKRLFYNPIEVPEEVHIVSKCFGVDVSYHPWESTGRPIHFSDLFDLAALDSFDEVSVYLTAHECAYMVDKKNGPRVPVTGWISLKSVKDGGYIDG